MSTSSRESAEAPGERGPAAGPLGDRLSDELSFLLARANALSLAAGNAAFREHGLKARSYSVLAVTAAGLRPSQRELADFLRLDPSQVVALVDELQGRGLVTREPDPDDRRTKAVVATAAGRALAAEAAVSAREGEDFVLRGLTGPQRETLAELLRLVAFPD